MSAEPIEAVDAIAHLDFDPDHACEVELVRGGLCGAAAQWLAINGCCGHTWEMCTRHADQFAGIVATGIRLNITMTCDMCHTSGNDPALYRVVPLAGESDG